MHMLVLFTLQHTPHTSAPHSPMLTVCYHNGQHPIINQVSPQSPLYHLRRHIQSCQLSRIVFPVALTRDPPNLVLLYDMTRCLAS